MGAQSNTQDSGFWRRMKSSVAQRLHAIANHLTTDTYGDRAEKLGKFWFLIDVPLFIDPVSISQLFDAMTRPEWMPVSRVRTQGRTHGNSIKGKAEAGISAKIPYFLDKSAKVGTEGSATSKDERSKAVSEDANRSPELNLEKIVNRYVTDFPERILYATGDLKSVVDLLGTTYDWNTVDSLLTSPGIRPIIVLDLIPGARILPMFAETDKGDGLNMSELLVATAVASGKNVPAFPKERDPQHDVNARLHWEALFGAFDSSQAISIVESAKARLDWIDYRIAAEQAGSIVPIHLHLVPRGAYPTGTFAYQFIRRAQKNGVRLIGTLKRGHDVNVLGIYER